MSDPFLADYLKKYDDVYLLELKTMLEDRGFAITALSPGISFYRNSELDKEKMTYPTHAAYSFDGHQARLLHEVMSEHGR